jgi:lysine 6-dehydrogenase
MKIVVLGAGLVGAPMARDLAKTEGFEVTVVDVRDEALERAARGTKLRAVKADLSEIAEVQRLASEHDLVLSAVPGFMGFATLKAVLETSTSCVDIAFFAEDPLELDAVARRHAATALVDMGVAPGMGSVLAAHAHSQLDATHSILTYVGGLPRVRRWPYEYAAVFSPIDVIEEYVRPARYVENGHLITRPALSDPELLELPEIGTLEAFNTDGLRTMATTLKVPNMKEKTLRYPGHIEKMAVLRATGLFGTEPVEVGPAGARVRVRPIDVTAKLLFPMWELLPGEADVTILRVLVEGTKLGKPTRWTYDLFDTYDPVTQVHAMARTTGYTATSAVRMLAKGLFTDKGVFPPELVGLRRPCVEFLRKQLEERGVIYRETVETL